MKGGNIGRKRVGHRPPSRIRYEQAHPVVSFRVRPEFYEKLQEISRNSGKSTARLIRDALESLESAKRIAHQQGYQEAKSRFGITYPCAICGRAIELTSDNAKSAASEYMTQHGWGHAECHQSQKHNVGTR